MERLMRRVVLDLEANGLLADATVVHCGVGKDIDSGEVFQFGPEAIKDMLRWLDTEVGTCIVHNGIGYDWPLLSKLHGYSFKGEKIDTLVISRLQRPDRNRPPQMVGKGGPHSIAAWGYRLGRGKPDHEDWNTFSPEMLHRCSEDVEILHLTYLALLKEAKDLGGNWTKAYKMSFTLFEILQRQEEYGWLVDMKHLDKSLSMLQHWMDRVSKVLAPRLPQTYDNLETKKAGEYEFVRKPFLKSGAPSKSTTDFFGDDHGVVRGPFSRISWRPLSLDKDKEVKDYLLSCGWEPMEWNKNDAGEVTSPKLSKDDPFDGVQGSMGRLIARRVQCKSRKSILEGWKERIRPDGRLSSFVTGLAVTGRAKHSNIVNVPNAAAFFGKWMRKCFTSAPDKILVSCDSKGCQDRMLGQRSKNEEFTKMLLEGDKDKGTDSHSIARDAVNVVLKANGIEPINRSKAKNFNYGWKFGASDNKLGKMVSSNGDVGLQIRKALEGVFAAQAAVVERLAEEWRRNAKKELKWGKIRHRDGWFTGLDGRPIRVESEHALLVYALQSDEALTMTAAYIFLYKKLLSLGYEWGKDWAYVCFYHDEYNIECRPEIAEEIKKHAEWAIGYAGEYFKLTFCPQQGDGSIGRNWYEVH
jgi:DNA polymerase-1